MANNLSLISASLIESARKLAELKQNPGNVPPGNIDAAEMQITNARNQLAQAEREAAKGPNAQQLGYYLSDIKKYYGYAQSYVKQANIWDDGLNQIIDTAVNESKNPPQQQAQQQQQPAQKAPARKPLPVREDVRAAQNQLYRANPEFAARLEQVGGVDGKLGRVTIQLLREYLPRYTTEDAVKYLASEEAKEHAPQKETEDVPPNPYNNQYQTWGG